MGGLRFYIMDDLRTSNKCGIVVVIGKVSSVSASVKLK